MHRVRNIYRTSPLPCQARKKRELFLTAFLAFLRLLLLSLFLSPFALFHQPMPFPLPVAVEAEVFTRSFGRQMGTPLPALPGEEARRSSPFPIVFPTAIFFTVRGEAGVQISSIRLPASFLCQRRCPGWRQILLLCLRKGRVTSLNFPALSPSPLFPVVLRGCMGRYRRRVGSRLVLRFPG